MRAERAGEAAEETNNYMTDEELNAILPSEGYAIVPEPPGYQPNRGAGRTETSTPVIAHSLKFADTFKARENEDLVSVVDDSSEESSDDEFAQSKADSEAAAASSADGGPSKGATGNLKAGVLSLLSEVSQASAGGTIDTRELLIFRQTPANLPDLRPGDQQFFGMLLQKESPSQEVDPLRAKEKFLLTLLLKVKNGLPLQRKHAIRRLAERALDFGPALLFQKILPLFMSPTLDEQERHLMVKVIDRVLLRLGDLVQPFVRDIMIVIEPLLLDDDRVVQAEAREIISTLSRAAGLRHMVETLRPSVDNVDEFVRSSTARAFAVVAHALGVQNLLAFIKAVCSSVRSWYARHTGCKIVQQIAMLSGSAVLPHLTMMVQALKPCLTDEQPPVRTVAALAVASLAEAAAPYGIEAFSIIIPDVFYGFQKHRGKSLAAFLKAMGYLIPLMASEFAAHYTRQVMRVLIREFRSPDEQMKKIVLAVIVRCIGTEGVSPFYIRQEVLPEFFACFWTPAATSQRRISSQLVQTTIQLSYQVGVSEIIDRIVDGLRDPSPSHRKVVMETIDKIIHNLGAADLSPVLETRLIEGILFAFQAHLPTSSSTSSSGDATLPGVGSSSSVSAGLTASSSPHAQTMATMLNGFGTVVRALGQRAKSHLGKICGAIKIRLGHADPSVRQQAADLIARVAPVMMTCGEELLLGRLGLILFELLGEEYPDVLGSILGALNAIVSVIGMDRMTPPIGELLPRLTPILKNRNEKVSENCINLVGKIADRGDKYVSPREWMRICSDLLEMLSLSKKAIHKAAVSTIGYIARAIGPQDVLATLLNNLKVQDRQIRVCTTVAIAIVAETCGPFTVLPLLMNEYRVPELNVRTGVLKSLSFMFEYIGEVARDYIYSVVPLLQDALVEKDLVHRQTACSVIKHMALDVYGLGCEDALIHLLNYVWPNIFETSPHVISAVMDAIAALTLALGPTCIFQYLLQGLFHPAKKVRKVYWDLHARLYLTSPEALVPSFPLPPSPPDLSILEPHELQIVSDWPRPSQTYSQELFLFY